MKKYILLVALLIVPLLTSAQSAPSITSIQSSANPVGTVDSGGKASIYGTGLSGNLTIKLGAQEPKVVMITSTSDTYVEFNVPIYSINSVMGVMITNSTGQVSNPYSINITVPPGVSLPIVSYFQAPAEDANVLHPGERASIYGTNIDSSYKVVIKNNEASKTAEILTLSGMASFITPNLNGGTYEAYVEKAGTMSNKVSVTVVSSEYFPVAQLNVTPTSVGFTYTAQKLTNSEKEAQILQIQTLLMQLIQQLIQLMQKQGA